MGEGSLPTHFTKDYIMSLYPGKKVYDDCSVRTFKRLAAYLNLSIESDLDLAVGFSKKYINRAVKNQVSELIGEDVDDAMSIAGELISYCDSLVTEIPSRDS